MKTQTSERSGGCLRHYLPRKQGFALISTLLMLTLLTVLALGLLSLASISLRSTSQGQDMAAARANARMALMLAIGQLQKEAGPDKRVSGRADILDSDAATAPADGLAQPHWCAVWKSPDRDSDYELDQGSKVRAGAAGSPAWLVSGSDKTTPPDPKTWSATTTGSSRNGVVMASGIGALGSGGAVADVTAPLVNLADPASPSKSLGNYAYWVSDEGIKANLSLIPNAASGDPARTTRYLAPAALASEQALSASFRDDFPVDDGGKLAKLATSKTIGLVMWNTFVTDSA